MSRPTELEMRVLFAVTCGLDPWVALGTRSTAVGSRKVSQALGRLGRKGLVSYDRGRGLYLTTGEGKQLFDAEPFNEEQS